MSIENFSKSATSANSITEEFPKPFESAPELEVENLKLNENITKTKELIEKKGGIDKVNASLSTFGVAAGIPIALAGFMKVFGVNELGDANLYSGLATFVGPAFTAMGGFVLYEEIKKWKESKNS